MKEFPTGFVGHGLYRHVDHRVVSHPGAELTKGTRKIAEFRRRFGIRFQPIMIFSFERSAANQFPLLVKAGFLALSKSHASRPPSGVLLSGPLLGSQNKRQ
jgi:hypothetical protein